MRITQSPSRTTALVIAMGALVIGGFAQELLLLIGHRQFGVAITIPLVILVAWL